VGDDASVCPDPAKATDPRPSGPEGSPLRKLGVETIRYAAVAAFSFCWILSVSALGAEVLGLPERLAVAIALVSALVINFTLLRVFVFPGQSAAIGPQFAVTAATSFSFRLLEYGIFLLLDALAGLNYLVATACAVIISAGGKFVVYRNVVFRRVPLEGQPPTRPSEGAERSSAAEAAKPPGS
jgi:putative flippase GtrA